MADLVITPGNVVAGASARIANGRAGATITAGQLVYLEDSSGKYKLADADHATAEVRVPDGIALNGASDGQPLAVQMGGEITIGGTLTAGARYYASGTAGGLAPEADLSAGERIVLVGIAKSTTVLIIKITDTTVASA